MALVTYELYVDDVLRFSSNTGGFNIDIGDDQFIDPTGGQIVGSYSYEQGEYLGWTTTQGGTTPDYVVGDTITVNGQLYLYSIPATQTTGKMYFGTSSISKMYFGNAEVSKVYFGQDLVYEKQASTISFTIGSATYQAEEGMTWTEWVNSSYNIISAYIYGSEVAVGVETRMSYIGVVICGFSQLANQTINANQNYVRYLISGCN